MSLIAELKRRSVFKVGAAYLVVGWLVIQAASIAFPTFEAPAWALRAFMLVVALGFPLALVLAWVFDVTPEGVKVDEFGVGTKRVFVAAAVIAALLVGWFMRGGLGGTDVMVFEAPLGEQSTAVLPFVNMSSDKENEYFSDGLTETLLHKLAQVPELKVAARTSSFAFKGKQQDIRAIGRELGVATVMEGSVQRSGDTLRITAQLVRTADGAHIWSRNYDRKVQDLFAIQDEIAGAVTEALIGALLPEAKAAIAKGGTQDLAAYDLYTKALSLRAIGSFDSLNESEALLKQVIERDPKFVDAMNALNWTWLRMAATGSIKSSDAEARIDQMIDRIDALDRDNPTLIVTRGVRAIQRGEKDAAYALFERGIALAPADPQLLMAYAINLDTNIPAEGAKAVELIARAVEIDPLNGQLLDQYSSILQGLKRTDEAIAMTERSIKVAPTSPFAHQSLGSLMVEKGRLAEQFLHWRKSQPLDPTDFELAAELALQLDVLGDRANADLWLAKAKSIAPGEFYPKAMEVQLAFRRGDTAAVHAQALPLLGGHEWNRRNNWGIAGGEGCLAAIALGKRDEFRAALMATRMVPDGFSVAAFKAVTAPGLDAKHLFNHIGNFAPCLFDDGPTGQSPTGRAQRAELLATARTLVGADWLADENGGAYLTAVLTGDRATVARFFVKGFPRDGNLTRAEAQARWQGVDTDPAVVKAFADQRAAVARESARLAQVLTAAGVSAAP